MQAQKVLFQLGYEWPNNCTRYLWTVVWPPSRHIFESEVEEKFCFVEIICVGVMMLLSSAKLGMFK